MATANSSGKAAVNDSVIVNLDDPRLIRLADSKVDNRDKEVRADHCRIRQSSEIVSIEEEDHEQLSQLEVEIEESETLEERRSRIREDNLWRIRQEEAVRIPDEEEEEEDEEDESESEIEEEERPGGVELMKPVFIPRKSSDRSTIEKSKRQQQALEESKKRIEEERKKETKQIVVDLISKDDIFYELQKKETANIGDDDDEMMNEAEEYEAHLLRKIARFKRDTAIRLALVRVKQDIEKKVPTEEEIRIMELDRKKKKKKKLKFMQRYFHKGAFFQSQADATFASASETEEDGIYSRDYSAPTGDDKMDKTILPKVMQVRNFGRRGRTKRTHLVSEDTTNWSEQSLR